MPDALVIAALRRLHTKACFLAELEDLVPASQRQAPNWVPDFVAHPITTLIRWGLVDAHLGFTPLTADEVLHASFDDRVWEVEFRMSVTAAAIEQALGRNIWSVTPKSSI